MKRINRPWAWVPTLYFAEGLPYVIVMTVSVIMYKRLGVSNADIAFYTAWLYLPWVIKPLWSPIVDIIGTKRRWILSMQALLAAGFAAVAFSIPGAAFFSMSLAAFWFVAFLSATHDIAADGFYMLGLDEGEQSLFVGIRTLFYRLALIAGQGGMVVLAGWLETSSGVSRAWAWCFTILSTAFAMLAAYHWRVLPFPRRDTAKPTRLLNVVREFATTFVSFFRKPHVAAALLFMLLYRFPEAMLIKLIAPFLLDSGANGGLALTTTQVGLAYGTVGAIGLMLGGIIGGIAASRGGLKKWLMPMAWSMSLTCLTFVYLSAGDGHSLPAVCACVFIEQFGYGFGGTAYTLYLIFYSRGERATAHYAMATGVMALGMMVPGMFAGALQESIGYTWFFIFTVGACCVTILTASLVKVPASFGRKRTATADK